MDDEERSQQQVGQLIGGRYRLIRLLGAGGMGAVYEAVHEFTRRHVAVKLMHSSFARSKVAAERFVREAQAPSSIGHPGIVEVLDGGRAEDGSLFLVLELLHGRTLGAAMRESAFTPSQLVPIAVELLAALGAAHDAGFVHRDIKPDNVFLVEDEEHTQVKLLDFGVISVLSDDERPGLTQAGSVLGTPLYMSPEQALGRKVDERSDLWSVGAVCYQALTGRPPFAGGSAQALIISISTEEHLPISVVRPGLPLRLVKVVERALAKQVDKRWQSAAEMSDALREAGAADERAAGASTAVREVGIPAAAVRSQIAAAAPEPAAANLRGPIAIALAMCAFAAGAGVWALTRSSDPGTLAAGTGELSHTVVEPPPPTGSAAEAPAPEPAPGTTATALTATTPTAATPTAAIEPTAVAKPGPPSLPIAPAQPLPAAPTGAGLGADVIAAALRSHDRELQRCFEDAVIADIMRAGEQPGDQPQADPAPVRIDAELTIDPSGSVQQLELRGDAPEAMRSCARAAIQSWKFPAAQGPSDIRFPMVFQPNVVRR